MTELCQPDKRNLDSGVSLENLVKALSQVPISEKVPNKIREMLEFAKKIWLYGYYEYDFYTLCSIYLFLLVETAIKERFLDELPKQCQLVKNGKSEIVNKNYEIIYQRLWQGWTITGFEKVGRSLKSIPNWFKEHQVLPARIGEKEVDLLRKLRNEAAHLTGKDVYTPAMAIQMIFKITDLINCLFDPQFYNKEPAALKNGREYHEKISQEFEKTIKIHQEEHRKSKKD